MYQKVQYNENSVTFAAHFAQHFEKKNDPTTVLWNCEIISTVNPIG